MVEVLLATKLHMPPLRRNLVARLRLLATLARIYDHKLTLVAAPAGFGKTTLVQAWIAQQDQNVGWLALDPADNSLNRFLTYLIHAFRALESSLGDEALALLRSAHRPQATALLTLLTNELLTLASSGVVVLDDYHVIDDAAIHAAMDFLITQLPPQIHLIIIARGQPPLTLARLRSQAQLLEITSADLRFTAVEVERFLADIMQINLAPADRLALEMRTEGWIAGLQLAALSLRGQEQPASLVGSISGVNRFIGDYLFEEVLQQQTPAVRTFLIHTALVDALCASLCDALLARRDSQAMLEMLAERQLFITPLDDRRAWYRYHPLFADLLRHQLNTLDGEQVRTLHQRASKWFADQGRLEDAIRHGLLAQDFERTADLIEAAFQHSDWVHRDMHRLLDWFAALPEAVTRARPKLALANAWLLLEIFADQWPRIEQHLRRVEEVLAQQEQHAHSADEVDAIRLLQAEVDLLRANHARHTGEPTRVIAYCEQALARLPVGETYIRSGALAHLATAYESRDEMRRAADIYRESLHLCRAADNIDGFLFATARLLNVLVVCGELREAEQLFAQANTYTDRRTGPDMGLIDIGIAAVYLEQNRLAEAIALLEEGIARCRPFDAWHAGVVSGTITLARVRAAQGQHDAALHLLHEIAQDALTTPAERACIEAVRARLLIAQGDFPAAGRWAQRRGFAAEHATERTEFEWLTLCRVLIVQAALAGRGIATIQFFADPLAVAAQHLQRLHEVAQSSGRHGSVSEICLLQALIHMQHQATAQALARSEIALILAEREGHVQFFVAEGRPVYQLLTLARSQLALSVAPETVDNILAAFPPTLRPAANTEFLPSDALTERELHTLRLLASDHSTEEIAAALTVSVATVRTYAKRIYSKLDVHSRAEAVYRARALRLIGTGE